MFRKLIASICLVALLALQSHAQSVTPQIGGGIGQGFDGGISSNSNSFPIAGAVLDDNFVTGQYFPGPVTSDLVDTRSTIKYVTDSSGVLHQIAINTLPISNAGLLDEATGTTNLFLQSNDYTASWTNVALTVGASGVAPDGTTTAQLLSQTTANSSHRALQFGASAAQLVGNAGTYVISAYVKAAGSNFALTASDNGGGNQASIVFDMTSGTPVVVGNSITGTTMAVVASGVSPPMANGYFRVWAVITKTATTAGSNVGMWLQDGNALTYLPGFVGTASHGIYMPFVQLEYLGAPILTGGSPSSYFPTTTTTASRAADSIQIQRTGIGTLVITYSDNSTQTLFLGPANKYTLASLNQPLITRITGTAATAPLRQVASATNFPISTISAAQVMSLQNINSVYRGDSYQLVIPNVAVETNTGGTLTCTAALQNSAGSTPFKFGGSVSGSTAGNLLSTDELAITVTGTATARIWCSSSNSTFAVMTGYSSGTSLYQGNTLFGATVTDVTQSTSGISSTTPGTFFGAVVIAARHKSRAVAVYGDSIAYGVGETGGVTGITPIGGVIVPSIYTALPTANYGIPGDSLSTWVSNHTARIAVAPYFTSFVNEYGVNDITSQTATQLEASLASMTAALAPFGPVISSTLPPSGSSSTDNYATTANQTPSPFNAQKQLYNTFVRALTPHFFEVAGPLEFSSGIWIVNGTGTGSPWSDVHPTNTVGYPAVLNSGNVNPAWIQ